MSQLATERVLKVHHWNDTLFSFRTTRDPGLRFRNGHFVMLGLPVEGKPLMRAYSVASANHDEHLEFFSIKVPNGPLTSRLQHLQPGDEVIVGRKPVGSLVLDDLRPGRHLYLLSTGTGLAPFISIIQDPDTYERFEKVVLIHGVRQSANSPMPSSSKRNCRTTSTSASWFATSCSTIPPSRESRSAIRAGSPRSSNRVGCSATSACRRSMPRSTAR